MGGQQGHNVQHFTRNLKLLRVNEPTIQNAHYVYV